MLMVLLGNTKYLKSWVICLLAVLGCEAALTIYIPTFREIFYNIIQSKLINEWGYGLILFIVLTAGLIIVQTIKIFIKQRFGLTLRNSLQNNLIALASNSDTNYPGLAQRIHEDSKLATDYYLTIITEIFISSIIVIGLLIASYKLHNIMFNSLLYTMGCIITGLVFHKKLIKTEIDVQKWEAEYRKRLENNIIKGETSRYFSNNVVSAIVTQLNYVLGFKMVSNLQTGLVSIVPFLVLVPQYFNNSLSFGEVMAGVAIFDLLVINATILISYYCEYCKAKASWIRIAEFYNYLK